MYYHINYEIAHSDGARRFKASSTRERSGKSYEGYFGGIEF